MNIKAYSFEHNSHSLAGVKRTVADQIDCPGIYFESFSDAKEMFAEINEIIESTDVILIGIESKAYLKFKPVFIKAFGYTPAYSEKISNRIGGIVSDEKVKKAHEYIPDESTELLSEDGTYSGFYVNENDQYVVVFPLIESELPQMLCTEALPFVKPLPDQEDLMNSIIDTDDSSTQADVIISKLKKYDLRLAIPSTPAAKLLKADLRNCEDSDIYVFFTPFVNDGGVNDPKQYAAELARNARELRSTEIGATISNVFREKKGDKVVGYYAYVGIATADKIVVKKLFADPDETVENLVTESTSELYSMIDKYIDEISFKLTASPEEIDKYETSLIEAEVVSDVRPEATISKKGIIAAIITIIIAVVLCLVITFRYGNIFVSPMDAPDNEEYQAGTPTIIETVEDDTTKLQSYLPPEELTDPNFSETESDTAVGAFDIPTTLPEGINVSDQNTGGGSGGGSQGGNQGSNNTTEPTTEPSTEPETTETTWIGDSDSF